MQNPTGFQHTLCNTPSPAADISRSLQFQIIDLTFRTLQAYSSNINRFGEDPLSSQSSTLSLKGHKKGEEAMIRPTTAGLDSLITIHWKPNVRGLTRRIIR